MTYAAFGLTYPLRRRMRWILFIAIGYLNIHALVLRAFSISHPAADYLLIPLIALVAPLLPTLTYGDHPLDRTASSFPAHMFALPLRTRSLVGWPILFGAGVMAMGWLLVAAIKLRHGSEPMPMLWPAALLAAATAWFQALDWIAFRFRYSRAALLVAALTMLFGFAVWAAVRELSQAIVTIVYLGSTFVAFGFAVVGVAAARRGELPPWVRWLEAKRDSTVDDTDAKIGEHALPFASAHRAQVWYEWRRCGWTWRSLAVLFCIVVATVIVTHFRSDAAHEGMIGTLVIQPSLAGLAACVLLPLMLAKVAAEKMGMSDTLQRARLEFPPFFATRPLATGAIVAAKLRAAAIQSLITAAFILVTLAFWCLLDVRQRGGSSMTRAAMAGRSVGANIAWLLIGIVGLVVWIFRGVVGGICISLTGRRTISIVMNAVPMMGTLILIGVAGNWISRHPGSAQHFYGAIPWLLGAAVAIKCCAMVVVWIALRRDRLVCLHVMRVGLSGWLLAAVCAIAAISLLAHPTFRVAFIVVILLPFNRLAAAPLALGWNRHR